jgi:NADH dehydrogenase
MSGTGVMTVAITGANSAVGQAILRGSAEAAAIAFVAAVRSDRAAGELQPVSDRIGRVARISYSDPTSLRAAFEGATAVIHLAGTLVERPGSTYQEANVETTRCVAEAAKESGVRKLVFVSAIGADEASTNQYWRTKGEAEAVVRASGVPYTVLRVPLLLGRGTEGAAALRRSLSRQKAFLVGGGRNLHQPLLVDDLARAATSAANPAVAINRTLDLAGPISLPDREIVERAANVTGRGIQLRSIPKILAWAMLSIRRTFSRSGFSVDALQVITADTKVDPIPAARELGMQLTGIDEMIRQSVADA